MIFDEAYVNRVGEDGWYKVALVKGADVQIFDALAVEDCPVETGNTEDDGVLLNIQVLVKDFQRGQYAEKHSYAEMGFDEGECAEFDSKEDPRLISRKSIAGECVVEELFLGDSDG